VHTRRHKHNSLIPVIAIHIIGDMDINIGLNISQLSKNRVVIHAALAAEKKKKNYIMNKRDEIK
jgi:hypothetical protein